MAKATRLAFGEALAEVGATNSRVVAFDADLSKSTMSSLFAKKFPDRFFEMGIQEANMIGAAAGAHHRRSARGGGESRIAQRG